MGSNPTPPAAVISPSDVPAELNGVELSELTFDVQVRGANWNSGNIGLEGDSRFTVPTLVPSA